MSSRHPITAALAALFSLAVTLEAAAGTIGFKIDAEVQAGPEVDATVTLTHTGDETASEVTVTAELLDSKTKGQTVSTLAPGQNHVWKFHFDQKPPGVYALVVRASYADANGYPFEIVSLADAQIGVQPSPRLFGSLDVPRLAGPAEQVAKIVAKRPPARTGDAEARLVVPAGFQVRPDVLPLRFDEKGRATGEFHIRNTKLLPGANVNVFALLTNNDAGFPQVDSIRGSARVTAPTSKSTQPKFYETAAALFLVLVILEAISRLTGSRSRTSAEEA